MIPYCEYDITGTGSSFTECQPKNQDLLEAEGVFAAYTESGSLIAMRPSVSLKPIELEFWGDDAKALVNYRQGGLNSSVGIETGVPFRVWDLISPKVLVFDGILDCANARIWEPDKVCVTFRQNCSLDMFYNLLSSLNFAYLRQAQVSAGTSADGRLMSQGQFIFGRPFIDNAVYEYKITAYQITYADSLPHAVSTLLHFIGMINQLWNAFYSTGLAAANLVALALGGFTVIAAGLDTIAFAAAVLNLLVIYAEMIGNIELMFNQFGAIGKYKYCMAETDIIFAILTYINQNNQTAFTFSSTIYGVGNRGYFDDPSNPNSFPYCNRDIYGKLGATTNLGYALTWMPEKRIFGNYSANPSIKNFVSGVEHPLGDETNTQTFPYWGTPDGNCKTWWMDIMIPFNAVTKLIPIAGKYDLQLEEQHYWSDPTINTPINVTLDNTDKEGYPASLPAPSKTNYPEALFDICLMWKTDPKDATTDQRYNGTTVNALIQPTITNSVIYWINPGGKVIEIPNALAKPKNWLNPIDQLLSLMEPFIVAVSEAINVIALGLLGKISYPNLDQIYPFLELSGDTFSVPKRFLGEAAGPPPVLFNQDTNFSDKSKWTGNGFYNLRDPYVTASQPPVCWQPTGNSTGLGVSQFNDPNGDVNGPYENYMAADVLFRLFGSKNLITPPQNGYNGGNQYDRYINKQVKMTRADFLNILLQGNVILWIDGITPCIIERLLWKMKEEVAEIDYRIANYYTKNLTVKFDIDGTA